MLILPALLIFLLLPALLLTPQSARAQSTDAYFPADQPPLTVARDTSPNPPGTYKISMQSVPGRVYLMQKTSTPDNPASWTWMDTQKLGKGQMLQWWFTPVSGQPRLFFRSKMTASTGYTDDTAADPDGDGLSTTSEMAFGTDPFNPDSDGDGMSDRWEITFSLNPLADDSGLDSDNDGLKNLLEHQLGTKPKRVGTDDGTDSDGDGLKDAAEYNNGNGDTDPAKFDMPILSIMQYSREVSLEDRRQPAYADRHNWTDSPAYRRASGTGFNGAGTQKPTWLNPGPWQTTGAMNPSGASNAFFDEIQGAIPWGDPQSVGTSLQAWLRQVYSWEDKYRVQRVRTRQIRYFLRASRKMPIEIKVRAVVTRWLRQGVLDAPWTGGGEAEINTLTLAAGQMDSNELTLNPTSYPAVTPGLTTDAAPRSVGDSYFTVSIREYPYTVTGSDSDGDGLPNTVEASMGTSTTNADTDGDGRKDFFDFVPVRAGALAPGGKAIRPSSPTEGEQPWIEYVWRGGHLCPATHWTGSDGDKNVINSHASHWDFGIKDDTLNPAPANSTAAMQAAWTLEPDFPLELPGINAPPGPVLDESKDNSTILYSHNLLKKYTTSGSTWPGGDGREALFRLRRETPSTRAFSRTFLIVDRKKTDTTAPEWTYTSLTPHTLTIPENKTVSNPVSLTANPLKLPDTVTPAGGKTSDHEVGAPEIEILDAEKKPTQSLRVASLSDDTVLYIPPGGGSTTVRLDPDDEPARFYVRVRRGATYGSGSCTLATVENPTYPDDGGTVYNDDPTEIDFEVDGDDLITKSLILVADHTDDDYPIQGIADDQKNDRSHLMRLGGKVGIQNVKLNSLSSALTMKIPVPILKTVTVSPVIMRRAPGDVDVITEAGVHADLRVTRERLAQAGVDLKWTTPIVHKDPPADPYAANRPIDKKFIFWFNGNRLPNEVTLDAILLFDALATPSVEDIHIFYIQSFDKPSTRGEAFPPSYYPREVKRQNNIILSADNKVLFSMSHELGHLLLNDATHDPDPDPNGTFRPNLMVSGTSLINQIGSTKRLRSIQITKILKNPLCK